MWSTPCSRATSIGAVGRAVVDDQPLDDVEARRPRAAGRRASPGACSSSLRQGIWMMSFMRSGRRRRYRAERSTRVHSLRRPYPAWRARRSPGRRPGPDRCRAAAGAGAAPWPDARASRCCALGIADRVLRLPDLPELRLATTRCCGAASCCTASCRASTATARRPSTRWRSPFGALLSLLGRRRRPADGRAARSPRSWRSSPGVYRLGAARFDAARRAGRRARCCCTRFDFPFLAARGYIDIPYLALRRVGGGARGRAPAARHGRSSCCWPAPGCCARRRGCSAACTGCGASWPAHLAAAHPLRRARRAAAGDLDARWTGGHRRPDVLADTTPAAWPRSSGAPAAGCPASPARR